MFWHNEDVYGVKVELLAVPGFEQEMASLEDESFTLISCQLEHCATSRKLTYDWENVVYCNESTSPGLSALGYLLGTLGYDVIKTQSQVSCLSSHVCINNLPYVLMHRRTSTACAYSTVQEQKHLSPQCLTWMSDDT